MTPTHIAVIINYKLGYFRDVLCGIRRYALGRPNWVFAFLYAEQALVKTLYKSPPDGVIAQVLDDGVSAALKPLKRPIVNISRGLPGTIFPRVGADDVLIGKLAAEHLLERRVRHFAFVGHAGFDYAAKRAGAFRRSLAAAGCSLEEFHTSGEMSTKTRTRPWYLDRRLQRWLQKLPKPVGILAGNDEWAAQLSEVCRDAGLRIPEDVALVGVDNDDLLCELARPPLSSVALPAEQIGYEAAALLDRLLSGSPRPRKPILLPPIGVVVRQSSDLVAIDDPEVAQALRFVQQQRHLPLQVADVLKQVPLSRSTLERRVERAIGRTLKAEIRRVHLERAKQLLSSSDLSMEEVATHAGYSDQKRLCGAFRKMLGCTPTEFRRQFRGDRSTAVRAIPHPAPTSARS